MSHCAVTIIYQNMPEKLPRLPCPQWLTQVFANRFLVTGKKVHHAVCRKDIETLWLAT